MLSPDRYADFQQATNQQYQQLNALVARLDLPLVAARAVGVVQTDLTARGGAVNANATLSAAERAAQLAAIAQEASMKISATLGSRGLEAYKQYGGQWVNNLARPPASLPKS